MTPPSELPEWIQKDKQFAEKEMNGGLTEFEKKLIEALSIVWEVLGHMVNQNYSRRELAMDVMDAIRRIEELGEV